MPENMQGAFVRRQELVCTEAELEMYGDKILLQNEVLYIIMNDGACRMKIGDGQTPVKDLPKFDGLPTVSNADNGKVLYVKDGVWIPVDNAIIVTVDGTTPSHTNAEIYKAVTNGKAVYLAVSDGTYVLCTKCDQTVARFEQINSYDSVIDGTKHPGRQFYSHIIQNDAYRTNLTPLPGKSYIDAIAEGISVINNKLIVLDGEFTAEFEIGKVELDENSALKYSNSKFEVRTKEGAVYSVPKGTTFTLSDYTGAVLIVYFSYDGGITYSSASRKASNNSSIVMEQDAVVAIRMYSDPYGAVQPDISFADLLEVDIQTLSDGIKEANSEIQNCKRLVSDDLNSSDLWEEGGITGSGTIYKANHLCRTKGFINDDVKLVYVDGDYVITVFCYDTDGNFVGIWNRKEISTTSASVYYLNTDGLGGYKLRLMLQRYDRDSSYKLDISESAHAHFLNDIHAEMFYPTPTLTFIDDDGAKNALENWESISDEVGIKITFCLNTGVMGEGDTNPTKASWEDVKRMQNKGFEFVSHTHGHINITEKTEETIVQDFENSINALREHGCESRYLVYPYNAIDNTKLPIVKKYFTAAVGMNKGGDNTLPIESHHIGRYSINDTSVSVEKEYNGQMVSVYSFVSLETLKRYIDTAFTNGSWLIIMTHLRNDGVFYHDEESRAMIVNLCKYAVQKGFKIQTFGEAIQRYKNVMENGRIYDANHYIVDCNGVERYRGQ